jgi:CO/xanthine dehydrogenase FAD-binding subunit
MIGKVHCPSRLEDLWPLLEDGAAVMAGGTDLFVRRRGGPAFDVACLEGIACLAEVREEDGLLRLGAGATHATLVRHPLVTGRLPVLAKALATLGSPPIRNMGTLGGNIVTASPAGDTLPPLYALEAAVELASRQGTRRLPLAELIVGPGRTALTSGEIVTAVLVPQPETGAIQHFEKVGRRNALAIAVVSLAAVIGTDGRGRVTQAKLALGSVGPTVIRPNRAEAVLLGKCLDRDVLTRAGALLREDIAPIGDVRATADYRREVAGNLLLRLMASV